jgi:hypothetical protein
MNLILGEEVDNYDFKHIFQLRLPFSIMPGWVCQMTPVSWVKALLSPFPAIAYFPLYSELSAVGYRTRHIISVYGWWIAFITLVHRGVTTGHGCNGT